MEKHRVTAIKQQVKRADRYSIFIDEAYAFSLSEKALFESGLRIGNELDADQIVSLKRVAESDKAYDKCIQLIARRQRSEWEVAQYLRRKSYEDDLIQATIEQLKTKRYLDDSAFAQAWVESRRLLKPTSKRKLQQELRQKRVPDDIITTCLAYDETDDKDVLRDLIVRKRTQTRYKDKQKLMQYLSRQGFSYGDIKETLAELD